MCTKLGVPIFFESVVSKTATLKQKNVVIIYME